MEKRTLLKFGLVGGALSYALPKTWVKPVVNAVVLPAHAQTSAMLSIPGFSLTADFGDSGETTYYQIDDRARSGPQLISVTSQNNEFTLSISVSESFTSGVETSTSVFVSINIGGSIESHGIDITSENNGMLISPPTVLLFSVPASVSGVFKSLSGLDWSVSYAISQAANDTIAISDIAITRI